MPAVHEIVKYGKKDETVQEILADLSHRACHNHGGLHRFCFIVDRAYAAALEEIAHSDLPLVEES